MQEPPDTRPPSGSPPGRDTEPIHPAVGVGHVHLRIADLDRALGFYRDGLGFEVRVDTRELGIGRVLLAAGDYHHHVAYGSPTAAGDRRRPIGSGRRPARQAATAKAIATTATAPTASSSRWLAVMSVSATTSGG